MSEDITYSFSMPLPEGAHTLKIYGNVDNLKRFVAQILNREICLEADCHDSKPVYLTKDMIKINEDPDAAPFVIDSNTIIP